MTDKKINKVLIKRILLVILLWSVIVSIDYFRVMHSFSKPIFTVGYRTADDDTGMHIGLGYSIYFDGNFNCDQHPDAPNKVVEGITYAKFKLFGISIKEIIRK